VNLDRLRHLSLEVAVDNAELPAEHQAIVDALTARDEEAGMAVIHTHSHRVLTDSARLQASFPDFFAP
jgi:DNA-binding GntR family transcriptional regulator